MLYDIKVITSPMRKTRLAAFGMSKIGCTLLLCYVVCTQMEFFMSLALRVNYLTFCMHCDEIPIALFAIAPMFLKIGWPSYVSRSKIGKTFERSDTPMPLINEWRLSGTILCLILILTPFNIEKVMENLCQHVSIIKGQRSFNGKNYLSKFDLFMTSFANIAITFLLTSA